MLQSIAFAHPWLLAALIILPVLWLLLRAIPPAPVRRLFPAVVLLLGLRDDDSVSDRTPWWLLLLRMLAIAALIVGLAGPVLNPFKQAGKSAAPLLVAMDASWASARDWNERISTLDQLLADASRNGKPAALLRLSRPEAPVFQSASAWRKRVDGLAPNAWAPSAESYATAAATLPEAQKFDTVWLSDGLAHDGRTTLVTALKSHGRVTVLQSSKPVLGLNPVQFTDGALAVSVQRDVAGPEQALTVQAHGRDPAGTERVLAELPMQFATGETTAKATLDLPAELRGRVTRFAIQSVEGAGAVALSDDSLRRREVALIAGVENREGLELLSPLYYLHKALAPSADLIDGAIADVLPAKPDVIILADVAKLAPADKAALTDWVNQGGLLVRFAGPKLAASDLSRRNEDTLMPVRLRAGGRTVGGAMSWGAPKSLAPFDKDSPFFGLKPPEDVRITAQVMAQPDPTLASRVIASLSDGTPLVTRKKLGKGQVVLFHVTANAEWSSLPLSGLFVAMLERLSISTAVTAPSAEDLAGLIWKPTHVLDGFGALKSGEALPGVPGETLAAAALGPDLQPGLYTSDSRQIALNVLNADTTLKPAAWPAGISVEQFAADPETPLGGWLLALALLLLSVDIAAALALTGRLTAARAVVLLGALMLAPLPGHAQQDEAKPGDTRAVQATAEVTLAHVLTGNKQVDDTAQAGLFGLSETLYFRTSVEPATPMSVNLETDELSFFPLLYWPITPDQPRPSEQAYEKLNRYLRSGGMILFDTRDGDIAGYGASSPNGEMLQQLAAPLDVPALEPVPSDHVLTRAFYLLQQFPGRYDNRDVWVEAAPNAEKIEGMPFRNLNDNVTPVIIGGNDWAAAWAMDQTGKSLFPVGRGMAGERQRELAYRFGVNLVMYVLTGNYKSDQVHVPALLERLGQ
ncbi:DUF4159 domain-containing protein [Aquicoccus sp. G2-2]|uniref:DUF4159 domain-containing protein n=1 Tax=Aquicoccus sp. G2-2 TaxID=3092120 RepID=UPI002ADFBB68|nr:DUF4159 domain-containing protein [Aquicoccus sp. G2-2]MEA1114386.1 DUF4159 domain-containing protein [Aquicoccus sp. G2-2]